MIKIAYFDLGITDFFEDYSINPKNYGGGPCFARYAKELLNNSNYSFYIFGQQENFQNLQENENKKVCISLSKNVLDLIKSGYPPALIIPELQSFDIIIHHHDCLWINPQYSKAKSIHWSLSGRADGGHPYNHYDLLYDHNQLPAWSGQKIKYIQIGKYIPDFKPNKKEDFIFTCTRHDESMNSMEVAKNCIKHGIKGYFGGPIHNNYPLMDYIDDKNTFYLGLLTEEEKLNYTRRARLYPILANWDVVFNQSALEANGEGTPLLVTKRGWFNCYIKDNINGYFYNDNFIESYEKSFEINQEKCNNKAHEFGIEPMINSFIKSFKEIYEY